MILNLEPGTKYRVIKGGKMLPSDPPYASKYRRGEIWVVHESSLGLQLLKNNRVGILNAPQLIRYGVESGKLEELKGPEPISRDAMLRQLASKVRELESDLLNAQGERNALPVTWNPDAEPRRSAMDRCSKLAGEIMRTERKILNLLIYENET